MAGVDGEAGRVRAMVGLGEEGCVLLWQVESRLLLSLLSTTFLACSSPRASSAAPFFRRRWRRERSSLRPVEISSTQYDLPEGRISVTTASRVHMACLVS